MRERRCGFTLTEVLLVTVLLAVISLGLYAAFSNGVRLWKRVNKQVPAEGVSLLFKKMSRELANSFEYPTIGFTGSEHGCSFPTMIVYPGGESVKTGIGRVEYSFSEEEKGIYREQSNYSEVYLEKPADGRMVVGSVVSASFQYYCYDLANKAYLWVSQWTKEQVPPTIDVEKNMPLAVKVEIELEQDGKIQEVTGIFAIPSGG